MPAPSLFQDLAVANDLAALRRILSAWREDNVSIALVPTMGALHEGHLSLIDLAARHADRVVASIFVNPAQFAPNEDFAAYPRDFDDDVEKLAARPCHLVYAPTPMDMYPDGHASQIKVDGPSEGLESAARPHFFVGVATIVAKLFNQIRPEVAVFGEKDYQQLLVIRQLNRDLDFNIEIVAGPTARESDGLAMSSRNRRLTPEQRNIAAQLYSVLCHAAIAFRAGVPPSEVEHTAERALLRAGFDSIDYVALRDADTLGPVDQGDPRQDVRLLAAARLANLRLIDNIAVDRRSA